MLGPAALLAPEQAVVLERDASTARAIARGHMAMYLALPNYVNNLKRLGYGDDDVANGGSDRLVDAIVAWGDADAVVRRIRAHHDACEPSDDAPHDDCDNPVHLTPPDLDSG